MIEEYWLKSINWFFLELKNTFLELNIFLEFDRISYEKRKRNKMYFLIFTTIGINFLKEE